MIRLFFLFLFIGCFLTGDGQNNKIKQVSRIPVDSAVMQSSGKSKNALVINGSSIVQTRASRLSAYPYAAKGGQQRSLSAQVKSRAASMVNLSATGKSNPSSLPFGKNASTLNASWDDEPQSVFIERKRDRMQLRSSTVCRPEETAYAFFRETPQLRIPNPELQIRIDTIEDDHLNMTHIKGVQLFRHIPVYGTDFTFHISSESERFMGCTVDTAHISSMAVKISADEAIRFTERDLGQTTEIQKPNEFMKEYMNYERPSVEAIYYPTKKQSYNYCYKVIIRPNIIDEWIYYIDAYNGDVVDKYNNTRYDGVNTGTGKDLSGTTRTVNTYLKNGIHYMCDGTKPTFNPTNFTGAIKVYDAKNDKKFHEDGSFTICSNTTSTWNNPNAISAMYYSSLVYDYLKKTFNRMSYDGKGTSMQAVINVCDKTDGGGYDNAYWNGSIIALGNGRDRFYSFAGALDVIAHEYGHAVTSRTAKFEYRNQSGALDEAYADIFGVMVDRSNWTMAETVVKDKRYYPTGFMRDMRNPHNGGNKLGDPGWQPAHVSEMYLGTDDYGGVHRNNSIPAHAFYTYAIATSKERAEQVFYRALISYLTPTSKFIDLRKAVIQAAKDFKYDNDVKTIENAFNKVGIVDDTVDNKPPANLPTNPGGWGLLLTNTDPADRNSLYKTSDYKNFTPLSTTKMTSTPSVTDDGKYTIFVDGKNNIRLITMATGKEETINSEGDNQSVAISRDGKRMAVITTYEDGRIYVCDRNSGKWYAFKLYNPTTGSDGAKSGGPRYADAIEFDHTGEYLIYDAYNVTGSTIGGRKIDYWDIGVIHVWDNSRNTFGTGEVEKLFTDIDPGVHVMNPVFSKNSPYIIAIDFYDEDEDVNATVGVNLANGDVDVLFLNNMPSYPSYSMDDKRIALTTYAYKGYDEYHIGYFNLGGDKISTTGDYVNIGDGGAYPVYYGTGTRVLGAKPVAAFTSDTRSGGSPLSVQFVDMSNGNPTSWRWTFTGGSPASSTQQHPKVTYNTAGTYAVTLVATNSYGSGEVVRQGYITVGSTGTEILLQEQVTVYPNPTSDNLWINSDTDKIKQVRLFDLTGKSIPITPVNELDRIRIDVSSLHRGIYILHIGRTDGRTLIQKIVKY